MAALKSGEIEILVEPFGPTDQLVQKIIVAIQKHKRVLAELRDSKFRILGVSFPESTKKQKGPVVFKVSSQFEAIVYDYTNNRTLVISGIASSPTRWAIIESSRQPPPTREEFEEAIAILRDSGEFSPSLKSGDVVAVAPMPPVLVEELEDGRTRRFIGVHLLGDRGNRTIEILGVDLAAKKLLRFPDRVPAGSNPGAFGTCGVPADAGQATANQNTPGQVRVTIKHSGKTIWAFVAVRPAASSGTNGSGIELRFVDLRGKRMLYRAHVPILNVKYDGDKCGPYRDWQWQEGQIQASGTAIGNTGFLLCQSPAKTVMDTGSDRGTFLGTAIYVDGAEVVFVSEMEAGWYRYVSEWRFHIEGSLKPRFGFAAVQNSCVCNVHHHHVYWRLDFDILTASGNRIEEFNSPPLSGGSSWHQKSFEIRRARDPSRNRHWKITNIAKGLGVEIIPGPDDGVSSQQPDDPFGRGDTWILKYRHSEIDDGVPAVGPPYEAGLDQWLNGEKIDNEDIVFWYAGHFTHDLTAADAARHGHILGPDIKPINWP